MKRVVLFILLTSGFCMAVLHLTAADLVDPLLLPPDDGSAVSIVIKNGKPTNHFVTLDETGHKPGKFLYPEYVEAKGNRYLCDYREQPDLKEFNPVISWGDARERRLYLIGKLEFRTEKATGRSQPVIVLKKLASGPMPVGHKSAESEINALENPFVKNDLNP